MHRIGQFSLAGLFAGGLLTLAVGCTSEPQSTALNQRPSADDKGVLQAGHTTTTPNGSAAASPNADSDRVELRPVSWDGLQQTLQRQLKGRVILVDYWMDS
jgi:hypothetical protein